jgi:hypothetical protein
VVGFCRRDGGATSAYAVAAVPRPTKRLKRRLREEKEGRYAAEAQVLRLQVELERAREEIHRLRSPAEVRQLTGPTVAARSRKATAVPEHAFHAPTRVPPRGAAHYSQETDFIFSVRGGPGYRGKGNESFAETALAQFDSYTAAVSATDKRQIRLGAIRAFMDGGGRFYQFHSSTGTSNLVDQDTALELSADFFKNLYMRARKRKSISRPFDKQKHYLLSKKGVQHYKGHQTLRQLVTPLWEIYSVTTSVDEKRQMRSNVLRDYIRGGGGFYKLNPDTEEVAEVPFDQAVELTADVFRYMCRRFQKEHA